MRSASSEYNIGLVSKFIYFYKLFKIRTRVTTKKTSLIPWEDIEEYEIILSKYSPILRRLTNHQVLEIGYGARPWRLLSMSSLGVDIKGIDLDRPMYGFNIKRLLESFKYNGIERFVKSFVRAFIFDRDDINSLKRELNAVNRELVLDQTRMVVGNAAEKHHFREGSFTFAFSEDVFEHIPAEAIPQVLRNIKSWLKEGAIFIVRPNIWTGISGGHDPDYYADDILSDRSPYSKAWSHLLDPDFKINTYLNRLRLADYIKLFSAEFEILEMRQKYERLGENYLTPHLLEKLTSVYTEEELLTNQIAFILRA